MTDATTAVAVIGTALTVGKPIVETGCRLLESLLGKPCKVAGDLLADEMYAWQWENRLRILNRTKQKLDEGNVPPRVLPKGFLLPLLDSCGNTEEAELQEMWAQLLTSSVASPEHQHPAFIRILAQLSRNEAALMVSTDRPFVISGSPEKYQHEQLWSWLTQNIPDALEMQQSEVDFANEVVGSLGLGGLIADARFHYPIHHTGVSISVWTSAPMAKDFLPYPGASEERQVKCAVTEFWFDPSLLGEAFLDACVQTTPAESP